MRWTPLLVLALSWSLGPPPLLYSQDKHTQITEVSGRSLEYWIKEIQNVDPSRRETALRAVVLFGPDRAYQAVPVIIAELKKHTLNKPIDMSVRVNGAMAVGLILGGYRTADGTRAADPKLIKDAVTVLKRFLADNQTIVKFRATEALGRLGPDAKETIPEVISVSKDIHTWETRHAASVALGQLAYDKINGPTLNVLNALYDRLGDGSVQVRLAAIQSLTLLGGPINPALRLNLVRALDVVANKDTEPAVRIWAHMSIMSVLLNADKDRVDAISRMLAHPDSAVRAQSAQALGMIGTRDKSTIPLLSKALGDPEPIVVAWALWALGRMGPSAAGTLPAIEAIKKDQALPEYMRKMAEDTMEHITAKQKS